MGKIAIVRLVVKLYFVGAITGSFLHIIESANKLGLYGIEATATPFMIDGLAVIGMVMRSAEFSKATQRTGLRTQIVAGMISLAANVYAADSVGGIIFGVGIVALFLASERLAHRIESAQVDRDREAAEKAAQAASARCTAARKAAATRKRKATTAKARKTRETKVLEDMIKA